MVRAQGCEAGDQFPYFSFLNSYADNIICPESLKGAEKLKKVKYVMFLWKVYLIYS